MKRSIFKGNTNVPEAVHEVTETLADRGQDALREAQKIVDRTGTRVRWAAEDLGDLVGTKVRHASRFVERNALSTALAAVGVGALVAGAIFLAKNRK